MTSCASWRPSASLARGPANPASPPAPSVHECHPAAVRPAARPGWTHGWLFPGAGPGPWPRSLRPPPRRTHRARRGGGMRRVDLEDLDDVELVAGGGDADELL